MAVKNRSGLYTKIYKVLKKHYKPVAPNIQLPLMQQLLYGCCLENASATAADKALIALESDYYDWNEVRVSTATELSESMHMLPDPLGAGNRARQILQSVFETNYSFDIEQLKKENIGAAVKKLQKLKGVTPFTVAYVTQMTLSGHSIPVGRGALEAFYIVGVVTEKEKQKYLIPGLERAIPKNRGIEFGSLLNQLGAELMRAPHGSVIRKILLEIAPDAKERLPKRKSSKTEEPKKSARVKKKATGKEPKAAKGGQTAVKSQAAAMAKGTKKPTGSSTKKAGGGKKKAAPANVHKTPVKKKVAAKKAVKKKATKKIAKKIIKKKATGKTAASRIRRRKPR